MMNMCKEVIDYEQVKLTRPNKDSIMALLMRKELTPDSTSVPL